jgi:hypothetical protein
VNAVSDWLRRDGGGSCVATTSDRSDPRLTHGADTEPKGMAEVYLVLSDDERAKGFIRPVRRSYRHQDPECGAVTTMGAALAETYARTPSFYGATYCAGCRMHRPVGAGGEFTWMTEGGQDTAELVGT